MQNKIAKLIKLVLSVPFLYSLSKKSFFKSYLNPSRPDPGQGEIINLNFYFHTSLWCLKKLFQGLKGTTKKCENKNLT